VQSRAREASTLEAELAVRYSDVVEIIPADLVTLTESQRHGAGDPLPSPSSIDEREQDKVPKLTVRSHHIGQRGAQPMISRALSERLETVATCFWLSSYVFCDRPRHKRLETLDFLPLFHKNSASNSPVVQATSLLAIPSFYIAKRIRYGKAELFRLYAAANKALQAALLDPEECVKCETIQAVLLMNLGENTECYKTLGAPHNNTHQRGAISLILHRGMENMKSNVELAMVCAVRSAVVNYHRLLRRLTSSEVAFLEMSASMPVEEDNFTAQIEKLRGRLLVLESGLVDLHDALDSTSSDEQVDLEALQRIAEQALKTDRELVQWSQSLPETWQPTRVYVDSGDWYEWWESAHLAYDYNMYRCHRLAVLRILYSYVSINTEDRSLLPYQQDIPLAARRRHIVNQARSIVDDIYHSTTYFGGVEEETLNWIPPSHGKHKLGRPLAPALYMFFLVNTYDRVLKMFESRHRSLRGFDLTAEQRDSMTYVYRMKYSICSWRLTLCSYISSDVISRRGAVPSG
jgi:hypothetical protein